MYKYLILIIIPILLVFKNIFLGALGVFGDSPFFYPDTIASLFSEPFVWVTRGVSFGGINQILWLSPVMFIYGALGKFLAIDNQLIVKILFYIPAIIFSIIGPFIVTKYLKFSKTVSFFSSLIYSLNTYFILLVDGGQPGVTLAYGLFPISFYFVKKLIDENNIINFFFAYLFSMLLCVADPRVYVVLILTLFIWTVLEKKSLKSLVILQIPVLLSNLYWLYPMLMIGTNNTGSGVASLQTTSLLNSLFLYSPHWPDNVFGKIVPPPFYFFLIPILLFGSFWFSEKHKSIKIIGILFLIFAFLSKGTTSPLGEIYNFLVNKIQFGIAFRDSSKFFSPLMLLGGILIGATVDSLKKYMTIKFIVFIYILFLIWPALLGRLNFNLSNRAVNDDLNKIYINLKKDESTFKSLWFPEKNPASYETNDKPAVDARELVKLNSIRAINASNDPFNFLNDANFPNKLARLGIKYIFLSGDPRNINPNESELKDWNTIAKLVSENLNLKKLNWGTTFTVYEISDVLPRLYKVDSLVGVIGPSIEMDVPAIYFEDGKLDPKQLEGKSSKSVKLFFNGKGEQDLQFSFLQEFFVGTGNDKLNQWAYYSQDDYLKAKYELLLRDIKYNDFDYGKGLSFSTQKGETIKFKFNVKENGEYILAVRKMNDRNKFEWEIVNNKVKIENKSFEYEIINDKNISVVNLVALIPKEDFDKAQKLTKVFVDHFGVTNNVKTEKFDWDTPDIQNEGTLKYKLAPDQTGFWIILNENYNSLWQLRKGAEIFKSIPINSEVNGFYFEPTWNNLHIEFSGQDYFRWGLYHSLTAILGTMILLLIKYIKNEKDN